MGNVLEFQARELVRRVSGHVAERAVDPDERTVERDERHDDRRFVDRETESLLRLAQLCDRGLQLTPSGLLCGQQPFAFVGAASRFRHVACDGAHAQEAIPMCIANQEMRIGNGNLFVRLEVAKERIA